MKRGKNMRTISATAIALLLAACGSTRYITIPMTAEGNACQRDCSTQSNTCLQSRTTDECNRQLNMCANSCPGASSCETEPEGDAKKCSEFQGKVYFVKDVRN